MEGQSKKSRQMTLEDIEGVTSSVASSGGSSPCNSPVGPPTAPFGPVRARVNRTRQRGNDGAAPTNATCGPTSSGSSASADRPSSSGSKSQAVTLSELSLKLLSSPRFSGAITGEPTGSPIASETRRKTAGAICRHLIPAGSIVFVQTWRERVTPSGSRYWAHTARGRTTNDTECIGWPTTKSSDSHNGLRTEEGCLKEFERKGLGADLPTIAQLAGWQTPTVEDEARAGSWEDYRKFVEEGQTSGCRLRAQVHSAPADVAQLAGWGSPRSSETGRTRTEGALERAKERGGSVAVEDQVHLLVSPWATPAARDGKGMPKDGFNEGNLPKQAFGATPTSSPAETAKPAAYRLNPLFSLWLMGFPVAWGCSGARAMQSSRKRPPYSSVRSSKKKPVTDSERKAA